VAERVLQAAGVPVLLVRAQERDAQDSRRLVLCRHILVPLDGSKMAEQVLPVVSPIALALGSKIILFRVSSVRFGSWGEGDWYVPLGDVFETVDQEAQAYLDHVASRLRAQEIEVSTATRLGAVAESIIEYAEANQIDLIAMCTHGRTGLTRWALGSVADRVLRAGSIPILLVRAK
jgi:nucleotide-binding universal stress UspA family protein